MRLLIRKAKVFLMQKAGEIGFLKREGLVPIRFFLVSVWRLEEVDVGWIGSSHHIIGQTDRYNPVRVPCAQSGRQVLQESSRRFVEEKR